MRKGYEASPLWKISVVTTPQAERAAAARCEEIFGEPAVSYTDADTERVTVSVYLPPARIRNAAKSRAEFRSSFAKGLPRGSALRHGKIFIQKIRPRDWAESWKRHFKPLEIGATLLIKPSWSKRRARKGRAVIVLDPGLSFGTGQHPTTAFCLRQLAARRTPTQRQAFLDIGTGSGILAIAAAKLGYAPIEGFDLDAVAVRTARANARRNAVLGKIHFHCSDLKRLSSKTAPQFDLICANLTSDLLASECGRIARRLKSNGTLILAGILRREFPSLARVCRRAGLSLVADHSKAEWRSGAFAQENR